LKLFDHRIPGSDSLAKYAAASSTYPKKICTPIYSKKERDIMLKWHYAPVLGGGILKDSLYIFLFGRANLLSVSR